MRVCPSCREAFEEGERFCPFDASQLEDVVSLVPPTPDALIGTVLDGRYRIVAAIGSGGMGKIYEAEHVTIRKPFAVKVLRDSESASPEIVARFRQEALSATRIGHENIVTVHDFGTTPASAWYLVMELLRGQDLAGLLAAQAPIPPSRAIPLLLQACAGLEAAHRAGIVHRDLKPENLFVTRDELGREKLKIVDFGLAKMSDLERPRGEGQRLTKTGMIFGTPRYMSPEQCLGRPAEPRSDVYSLGVIAYELLAGVPPFDATSFLGVLHMHTTEPVPPMRARNPNANVDPRLEAVVHVALAKDPEHRYPSMQAFAQALASYSASAGLGADAWHASSHARDAYAAPNEPAQRFTPPSSNPPASGFTPPASARPPATSPRPDLAPQFTSPSNPPAGATPKPSHATRGDSTDARRLRLSLRDIEERPPAQRGPEPASSSSSSGWIVPTLVVAAVGIGIAMMALALAKP